MANFIYEVMLMILTSLVGYIIWLLKEQKKERDILEAEKRREKEEREEEQMHMKNGMVVSLREILVKNHDKYMEKGSIPLWAYQHYEQAYTAYTGLKANGIAPKFKKDVDSLPIEEDKK